MLIPGALFPSLTVPLLKGGEWTLKRAQHELTLVSIIRGHFCTYCHDQVVDLNRHVGAFADIGIDIVATSADTADAAEAMVRELNLSDLKVGSGMTEEEIRRLGLFATERGGTIFSEPAMLIARRDGTVYAVFQNSISCGRIDVDRLLEGLKLLAPHGFPLRGNA